MTTHWPLNIYEEEKLKRTWWLHIILVVVWAWNVVVGGWWLGGFLAQSQMWDNQNTESPDKRATPHPAAPARPAMRWRSTRLTDHD